MAVWDFKNKKVYFDESGGLHGKQAILSLNFGTTSEFS
jgi:hypothetical protein